MGSVDSEQQKQREVPPAAGNHSTSEKNQKAGHSAKSIRIEKQRKERLQQKNNRSFPVQRQQIVIASICLGIILLLIGLIAWIKNQPVNNAYPPIDGISCDSLEHSTVHYHVHLSLYINGQSTPLPAQVGIAPDGSCLYWLHTHDTSGVIHIETPGGDKFTFGDFLDEWNQRFNTLQYPSQLSSTAGWTVYVNGTLYTGDFRTIVLTSHELITMAYNSPGIKPDTSYSWGNL